MHRKNIQVKLLIAFCLVIAGCDDSGGKKNFFEEGVKFFEQDELKKAKIAFKNTIKENPKHLEVYYHLALLNEKEKNFRAMKKNLLEATTLNPEHVEARLKLSKVHLLFNDVDDALKEVEFVLAKDIENLDALAIKATILIRQKNLEEGSKIVNSILLKNSDHIEALSVKTMLLLQNKSFDDALAIIAPATERHPENISLRLLKIRVDSKRDDLDSLIIDYKKLIELKPESVSIQSALAKIYIKAERMEEAETVYKSIVKKNPELIGAKIQLLDFLYESDKLQALGQAKQYILGEKDNHDNVIQFSKWFIGKKEIDKASAILSSLIGTENINKDNKAAATLLLAKIALANKEVDTGLGYIDQLISADPKDYEAKLLKAQLLVNQDKLADASQIVDKILMDKPTMDKAISLLGQIHKMQGDMNKANGYFKDALKINPKNLSAVNFITDKAINEGHLDYAIKTLQTALVYMPTQLAILTKLVDLNILEKKWEDADRYIDRIQRQKNGDLFSRYLKAKVLQKQQKYSEAISVYKDLLNEYPWLKDALTGVAESYLELEQKKNLTSYLDNFIIENPNIASAYLLKSQMLSLEKKNSKATQLLNRFIEDNQAIPAPIYIELARLHVISGNKLAEYNTYMDGLKTNPENINLLLLLAANYEEQGKFSEAVARYEQILQLNPRQKVAKNNLATILIDQYGSNDDIDKAIALVETFKQSKQPYYLDTYGWAQLKKGNMDRALSIFKQVILINPDVPVFRYHLAIAYNELNDSMSAVSELRQALHIGKGKQFPEKTQIEALLKKLKGK